MTSLALPSKSELVGAFSFNVKQLKEYAKVHDHVKASIKKGLVQLFMDENPILAVVGSVGEKAILQVKISDVINKLETPCNQVGTYVFRNTSYSGNFVVSNELFNSTLNKAEIVVYKRSSHDVPEFVQSCFEYTDMSTQINHRSLLENVLPFDALCRPPQFQLEVVFCNKAVTGLQKWLREAKKAAPGKETLRVAINSILGVLVLSLGDQSKTLTYTPTSEDLATIIKKGTNQQNWGTGDVESTYYVGVNSFLQAIGACKIPGIFTPSLAVVDSQTLRINAFLIKKGVDKYAELSVMLLSANPEEQEEQEQQDKKQEESCPDTPSSQASGIKPQTSPAPSKLSPAPLSTLYRRPFVGVNFIDTSDSEDTQFPSCKSDSESYKESQTPLPGSHPGIAQKRKPEFELKTKTKKPKTTFNPMF